MARWDNYSADEFETSDGKKFSNMQAADSHQDELDQKSASSSGGGGGSSGSAPSGKWYNPNDRLYSMANTAVLFVKEGNYDKAIELCDESLQKVTGEYHNNEETLAFSFAVRGSAYVQKGMAEKGWEDMKEGANYGNQQAKQILAKNNIPYTPAKPKTWDYYFPNNIRTYHNPWDFSRPAKGYAPSRDDVSYPAASSASGGKSDIFAIVLGIAVGFGLLIAAGWIYLQVTGKEMTHLPALILLAGAVFVSALFIGRKAWKIVIPLFVLAAAGYLVLFGIIPERLVRRESAAVIQTNAVSVISDGLNLRAEASGGAAVVKTLKKGDRLTITGEAEDGWTPVEHEGDKGWVSSEYLERN